MDISVIVRTYNAQDTIHATLKSVLAQSLDAKQYEIIVIDDGSTDNTLSLLKNYQDNVILVQQEHKGPMAALNNGIEHAKGKYIIILDSDDEFTTNTLKELLEALKKQPRAAFAYSDYYERDATAKKRHVISPKNNIFDTIAGGVLWNKRAVKEMNGYDPTLIFPEYDLILKALKKYSAVYVPKILYYYNRRTNSLMGATGHDELGKQQLRERYGDIPEIQHIRNY